VVAALTTTTWLSSCADRSPSEVDEFLAYAKRIASERYEDVVDISPRASEVFKVGQEISLYDAKLVSRGFDKIFHTTHEGNFYLFVKRTSWGTSPRRLAFGRKLRIVLFTEDKRRTIVRTASVLVRNPLP